MTQVHPHLYAAEALLYAGVKYDIERYIKSSQKATAWAISLQLRNGGFPRQFIDGKATSEESIYELIQTLRLWLLHEELTNIRFEQGDLQKAVERLFDYQCKKGNEKIKNGLYFQLKGNKTTLPHINGGAPLAAIQTLIIYYQSLKNCLNFDVNLLI